MAPLVAAPLTGVNVSSADVPRSGAWETWSGRAPEVIGDILFARTWEEFAGDVPGVGVDFALNLHVPPVGSPPNPRAGIQMELSIPLFPNQDSDGTFFSSIPDRLERGANGDYDNHWRSLAEKLVARGLGDAWLRPGWEMNIPDPLTQGWDNGKWLIGNSSVAKHQAYAAYWRRFHAAMMSVEGAEFKWTFCLLAGIETMESVQRVLDHAYPGDAYVDFISADFYDNSNHARYFRGNWQRFGESWSAQVTRPERDDRTWEELAHGIRRTTGKDGAFLAEIPSLDHYRQFARERGKPFMISEWGLTQKDRALPSLDQPDDPIDGGNDNPEFIARVAEWANANDVFALVYFDFYLSRQNPLYGENRANYVDHALMDGYWNLPGADRTLHPSIHPSPRSAATYLTAFHTAPLGGIPPAWQAEGRALNVSVFELETDGLTLREIGGPIGPGWTRENDGGYLSGASSSLLDAAPLERAGTTTMLVTAEVRAAAAGAWAGLRFFVPGTGAGGYAFEARCGPDGLPDRWRLRRNGVTVWISEREPILSRLENKDWRSGFIPMAARLRPGPAGSRRIEMFFGADTAGHFIDISPPASPIDHHFGVVADRAGVRAARLSCHEFLAEEDFEDGEAENFTDGGWVERRLHYRADPTPVEKQALAGLATDHDYRARARVGLTTPGTAGFSLLLDGGGGGYRVEWVAEDRPDGKSLLQRVLLRRLGPVPLELASWTPTSPHFLGAFHDLEAAAESTPAGDLRLTVKWNTQEIINVVEAGQAGRTGRAGPWAAAGSNASFDEFALISLAANDPGGETYVVWRTRRLSGLTDPLQIGPGGDPDGDGVTNALEHLTGTNPLDPASAWRLQRGQDGLWRATALPGRRYRWQTSTTLTSADWEPVGDWIPGAGQTLILPPASAADRRFFRLLTEWAQP